MKVRNEPRSAPERSRAETRRRLVAAATQLFARRGLHAVTSLAIAGAAGVAAGTFYLHFRDKYALFREISLGAAAELEEQLAAAGQQVPDAAAVARARARALLAFASANRDRARILFQRAQEVPELASEVLDSIAARLEERLGAPGTGERTLHPGVAAQAITGMLARIGQWWTEKPARADRAAVEETLTRLQLGQPPSEPTDP